MKNIYEVLKDPVITEKGTIIKEEGNKVAFYVDVRANKKEIKEAIENIFGVKVDRVNTMKIPGKLRRMGRSEGKTSTRKKAYVTLKKGEKIEIFEGV